MNPSLSDNPFRESRLNDAGHDYHPAWDVPSLNEKITQFLVKEINQARGRTQPDPGQLVPVLLSAPGYGKTHLFGRLGHLLDNDVFFVFIPGFDDLSRPLEHVRWHVVESFLRARPGKPSVHARTMAELCHPSFVQYVTAFPPSLEAKQVAMLQALSEGPAKVLEMVSAVKEITPFQTLASSVAARFPDIAGDVMRALVLAWSPTVGQIAKRWLRGGELLPDADLAILGVSEEPPSALDVLCGISAILQHRLPLVLCCDQMELALRSPEGPRQVTVELMEILHQVPNQVLMLSCMAGEWPTFAERAYPAFMQRTRQPGLKLEDLREPQALELIAARIDQSNKPSPSSAAWPFDEGNITTYVREKQPTPRILIQKCASAYAAWVDKDCKGLALLNDAGDGDLAAAFRLHWNQTLEKIRQDASSGMENLKEDRLYRSVHEALLLGRDANRELGGIRIKNVQENAVPQKGKFKRYSLKVDVQFNGQTNSVIAPITLCNQSKVFQYYCPDWLEASQPPVAGTLIIHRLADFQMGAKTRQAFDAAYQSQRLRVFALEENEATFERLEALLRLLDQARSKELVVGGLSLSDKDCQDLLLKTAVLDNLELFKALAGWCKGVPAAKAVPVAAAKQAATVAASVPVSQSAPSKAEPVTASATAVAPAPAKASATAAPPVPPAPPTPSYSAWCKNCLDLLCKKLALWGQPVQAIPDDPIQIGPAFARLKVLPSGNKTTFKKICDKAIDLRIHLGLDGPPFIDQQTGFISVDVALPNRRVVTLAECLAQPAKLPEAAPAVPVGVDVTGKAHWLNLSDPSDCHVLVAGTTGSGKSEFLRAFVVGLARRLNYEQLQFLFIDPKQVTFNLGHQESPYLRAPVAHDGEQALELLQWCVDETKRRYEMLAEMKLSNVVELEDQTLVPRYVVIIDEFANLMEDKKSKAVLTALLKQIGSMSRAAGIHLILATQRPDKDVVTPLLRDNLPGRIALQVKTEASSKLILGDPGAANLLGKGDLLWQRGAGFIRLQSPLVSQQELESALKI